MNHYYNGSAWTRLYWHRTLNLQKHWKRSAYQRRARSVRQPARAPLLSLRMTLCFRRCSTETMRTLRIYAKQGSKSNQLQNVRVLSGSSTSASVERCRSRSAITGPARGGGRPAKAAPSTCRTSNEDRSYAKRSWLPKAARWSLGTYLRLSREFSRGFRITKICSTSSREVVTLTRPSGRRCSISRALRKSLIPTFASLRSQLYLDAGTVSVGLRLPLSYSSVSSVLHPCATPRSLPRRWA